MSTSPEAKSGTATAPVSAVEQRLAELGITLPEVEGLADEPTVSPEDAQRFAAICAVNALAAVKSVIGDLDRITRIVKVVGFVSSDPSFTGQPGVINGASELLGRVLGDAGQHARSAVGVSVLPLDSPVEVELIAEFS
jgi:enamine deaminase RidA (YjgF/YER057c/UK114 family)